MSHHAHKNDHTATEAPKHTVGQSLVSVRLKADHSEVREQLRHMRASLDGVEKLGTKDARKEMDRIIAFMEEHVEQHTRREDTVLYPKIENYRNSTALTAALRVEHRFLLRNFDALRTIAAQPTPDAASFVRLVDNLLGLLFAHMEAEEEVLFHIVDEMIEKGHGFES